MPLPVIYPQLDGVQIKEDRTLPVALLQAIRKAYDYIVQIDTARTAQTVIAGTSTVTTYQALTGPVTINSPGVPADGALWMVRLDQDVTGGRPVAWGTGVELGPLIDATTNSAPLTMCIVSFTGFGGKWYVYAAPMLGVPII